MTGPDFVRIMYCHGDNSAKTLDYIRELKEIYPSLENHRGLVKFATDPRHGPTCYILGKKRLNDNALSLTDPYFCR